MAVTTPARQRPSVSTRRFGYVVGALVDAILLYAVNRWPGWDVVPYLTGDFERVVGLVNASLIVGLVANLVFVVRDHRRLKSFGDLVVTGVGLAALTRLWQVFPFDFGDHAIDWDLVARIVLVAGMVGSGIGILVALIGVLRPGRR